MIEPRRVLLRRTIIVTGVIGGLVSLFLGIPATGKALVMPGPLTSAHATFGAKCENCHGEEGSIKSPLHGLFWSEPMGSESDNCLHCHDLGGYGKFAHGSSPEELDLLTAARGGSGNAGPARGPHGEIACASCHREHQGPDQQMTQVPCASCQPCHADECETFGADHAEIAPYPHFERKGIAFTHQAHRDKHFAKDGVEFDCASCHSVDDRGELMLTESYENACTTCHHHERQIRGENRTISGIPFLVTPAFDLLSLEDLGREIEGWPADSEDVDGELTPFLRLLLASDPQYPEFEEDEPRFDEQDWFDLSEATDEDLAAVSRLADAYRRLLTDLASEDSKALASRYARLFDGAPDDPRVARLVDASSAVAWRGARDEWFPDDATSKGSDELRARFGGAWVRDENSLYYEPAGHDDEFLKAWHDLAAESADSSPRWQGLLDYLEEDGRCMKCHTVDRKLDGEGMTMRWTGFRPPEVSGFTKFSHQPHLILDEKVSCLDCHPMEHDESEGLLSDFGPATMATCAECHSEASAAGRCVTCHNYHVGRPHFETPKKD